MANFSLTHPIIKYSDFSLPHIPPRRAPIACSNCRKRKVRCKKSVQPSHNVCQRCAKRGLPCQYLSVYQDSKRWSDSAVPRIESHGSQEENLDAVSTPWAQSINPHYLRQNLGQGRNCGYDYYPSDCNKPTTARPSIPQHEHLPTYYYSTPPTRWPHLPSQPSGSSATTMESHLNCPPDLDVTLPLDYSSAHAAPHLHGYEVLKPYHITSVDIDCTQWNMDERVASYAIQFPQI